MVWIKFIEKMIKCENLRNFIYSRNGMLYDTDTKYSVVENWETLSGIISFKFI